MDWDRYDAALFDLDGVLTPTALVHMRAWDATFTALFRSRGIEPPYGDDDYFRYVDGRPRYDAVRAVLASRAVVLPEGSPEDPPGDGTVHAVGNAKNAHVLRLLADGVEAYPDAVALLDRLAVAGLPCAVVSSSRNARAVLDAARLTDRFRLVVDGVVAAREGLAGKPSPATFAHAAHALGVPAGRCVVLEDAVSGVAAGAAGGFGLVVGVDRGAGAEALRAAGADVVVTRLTELVAP
ncbi:HAD family hydrolase [Cellulomonas telluris]|uniref:HAD family hydrolase n=1 Tax=Cellulomonas telluris TaxID=2306636 RepID=UPI0010A8F394|nr:HAD-IA family hydrolase [Cellulomonas telluris]